MNYYDELLNEAYDIINDAIYFANIDRVVDKLPKIAEIRKSVFIEKSFDTIIVHEASQYLFNCVENDLAENEFVKFFVKYVHLNIFEEDIDDDKLNSVLYDDVESNLFSLIFTTCSKDEFNEVATIYYRKKKIEKLLKNI